MRKLAASLCVLVLFVASAVAEPLSDALAQLGTALDNRIAALAALPKMNKRQKLENKKLTKAKEKLLLVPNTGQLRDLFALPKVGSQLLASGTRDQAIADAVVAIVDCVRVFADDEIPDAVAARDQLTDPKNVGKVDKLLAKANRLLDKARAAYDKIGVAAMPLFVDAATAFRVARNKAQELREKELTGM